MKQAQCDVGKYYINSKCYSIARYSEEIAPIDLFSQLSLTPLYPKIYWSHRDDFERRIVLGKILGTTKIPKIRLKKCEEGFPFDIRFYGGKAFQSNPEKKHPFESFKEQYFFLPEFEIVQNENRFFLYTYQILSDEKISPAKKLELHFSHLEDEKAFKVNSCSHVPDYKTWEERISKVVQEIQNQKLEKVVVARQSILTLSHAINPYKLLKKIQSKFLNSSFFCFQFKEDVAYLGATPECLYSRKQLELKTEAIAGTCSNRASTDLLSSHKELDEFSHVSTYLSNRLEQISSKIRKDPDKVVNIGYLKHLYSGFSAELLPSIYDAEVIEKLFPSPALCGVPQDKALEKIKEIEDFNRYWFTCPIGWVSEHSTELIIAIRSCLISKENIYLFVANGIVKDSDPQEEWEELNTKMSPFFSTLNYE